MNAVSPSLSPVPSGAAGQELAGLLGPGVVSVDGLGGVRFADARALELLGCADGFELAPLWERLKQRLEAAGLEWDGAGGHDRVSLPLPVEGEEGPRPLLFDLRRDPAGGGVLLVHGLGALAGLEGDLRLTSQMRSVSQISPAVAHDLRAPINAMVFNIEILKEMLASGRAADPANKDKLLRYVNVLKEELSRLHRGLETYLAYISPRGDKQESFDLRELGEELAALLVAPARKQQAQVHAELPEEELRVVGNRYLLRQALLHLALAALAGVQRQGALHVLLEPLDGRARLRIYGTEGEPLPGLESPPPPWEAATQPVPGFDLDISSAGALAQLWVARTILQAHGGEARAAGPEQGDGARGARAYEIELALSGNPDTRDKGAR